MKITIAEKANKQTKIKNPLDNSRKERSLTDLSSRDRTLSAEFRQLSSRIISRQILYVIS